MPVSVYPDDLDFNEITHNKLCGTSLNENSESGWFTVEESICHWQARSIVKRRGSRVYDQNFQYLIDNWPEQFRFT